MNENENYDLDEIKERIDLVEFIGQYTTLELKNGEWWGICPLPNHKEDTASFSVNNDDAIWYCHGCGRGGNIFTFVMLMKKVSFYKALKYLAELTNVRATKVAEILKVFKHYKELPKSERIKRNHLPSSAMNHYTKEPIAEWIEEGILPEMLDKYQVRVDAHNKRIVFPIWDNDGNIVSISGRTLIPNYKELDIRKYIYYGKINCLDFFYGYFQNKSAIEKCQQVILFEGAKSVMKAEGWGYSNCAAILTSHVSPEQIVELIKMNCKEIVFALDKNITDDEIIEHTRMLKRFKLISIVKDRSDLLGEKDSPVDKGKEVWEKLFNERRIIN